MQVVGIGLNTKSELKNIKSLLKVGEIIEVNVISKKGKNIYLLQIKGNVFEGLSTKNLKENKLNVYVESTDPNIILKSEKDSELEIKLNVMLKKATNQILSNDKNGIVIKTKNDQEAQKIIFNTGDIIEAEVVSKKSSSTYILKIDKTMFEAFAKLDINSKDGKLMLLVEKVKPEIVLKVIDKQQEKIEYIKGKKSITLNVDKSFTDKISDTLSKIESSAKSGNKKDILINSSKIINTTNEIKAAVNNLKTIFNKEKNLSMETSNAQNHSKESTKQDISTKDIKNAQQKEFSSGSKKQISTLISKAIHETKQASKSKIDNQNVFIDKKNSLKATMEDIVKNANKNGNKSADNNLSTLKNNLEKLENLINLEQFTSLNFTNQTPTYNNGFLEGFLKELSKSLDKILSNSIQIEENAKLIEKAAIKSQLNNIKEPIAKIKNILNKQQNYNAKNLDAKIDIQAAVENVKNIIQHIKIPPNIGNIFIQVPIFIDNKKGELYISKKEEENKKTGKRSFKVRVVSDMSNYGTIQIDGIYFEKMINCSVGFENKELLKKFNKDIENLQNSLGENVTVSSYLIKTSPIMLQKQLNIKI